jgi:hypothetical protein
VKITSLVAVMATASIVAGCVSNTTPVPPCCYAGAVTTARLASLALRTEDGRSVSFGEVFGGFTAQEGLFARTLPFDEVQRHEIDSATLQPLLSLYDANQDGRLEKPEVIVLYALEAARATGTRIRHFGTDAPIRAISAPNADVGGLVHWAQARRGSMTPEGQAVLGELERLGRDLRVRGSEDGREAGMFDFD